MGARRNTKKTAIVAPRRQAPAGRNRHLLGMLMLLTVLGGGSGAGLWLLAQPDTLPIQRVQVEGEFRYLSREVLHAAIGEPASGGFFNVDVRAVKRAAEALAWVDRASVWRVWPNTLQVRIIEQVPLARWGDNGIVNARGEVFRSPSQGLLAELRETLPQFSGPVQSAELVAARYQLLSAQLAPTGQRVRALHLNARRAWEVRLGSGLRLLLGRTLRDGQMTRFADVYARLLADKAVQMESVDLRYTNGFAVRWKTPPKLG
jgi:cell division protein FtsQ